MAEPLRISPLLSASRWLHFLPPVLALLIVLGYGFFLRSFWAPAPSRPGIDENAYLLGGVNLAEHGTAGFKPANDYQFVGAMWFRNSGEVASPPAWVPNPLRRWLSAHPKPGWYFPKYPLGLPALNALAIKIGSRDWTLAIPPVAMTLAAAGIYLLAAEIVTGFFAILAMIVLMFGPTSLQLAEMPNSHCVDLCAVVWGMWLLLRWWRSGGWAAGIGAGLLLGIAVTFRYSEALLLFPLYPLDQVLGDTSIKFNHPRWWAVIEVARLLPIGPLGLAVMWRMTLKLRRRSPAALPRVLPSRVLESTEDVAVTPEEPTAEPLGSVRRGANGVRVRAVWLLPVIIPLLAWGVPVSVMLIASWFTTGHLTGYDATHESNGFSTADFLGKWDFTLYQLHVFGLFLVLPFGLTGLIMIFRGDRRVAWMLTLWFVPGALLYTAYYWGEDVPGVGFLRFFLSLLPPVIIAAMWVLWRATERSQRSSAAGLIGAAFVVTASAAIGLYISLPQLERQHRGNLNLAFSTREILHFVHGSADPARRPVVFVDDGVFPQLLLHLQMMTDADWFASDAFEPRVGGGFGIFGMFQQADDKQNNPVLLQRDRMDYIDKLNKGKTDADFVKEQRGVIDAALHAGRPVFVVLTPPQAKYFRQRVKDGSMTMTEKSSWTEPCADHVPAGDDNPRNTVGRNAGRDRSPLAPPNWSGEPLIRWHPQTLELYQIGLPARRI